MDGAPELLAQKFVNQTFTGNPVQSPKRFRDDLDAKMRLALGTGAGMASMPRGFVDDVETSGLKGRPKLGDEGISDSHGRSHFRSGDGPPQGPE